MTPKSLSNPWINRSCRAGRGTWTMEKVLATGAAPQNKSELSGDPIPLCGAIPVQVDHRESKSILQTPLLQLRKHPLRQRIPLELQAAKDRTDKNANNRPLSRKKCGLKSRRRVYGAASEQVRFFTNCPPTLSSYRQPFVGCQVGLDFFPLAEGVT